MATESLIIELDAKTKKLDTKLDNTNKRLDRLDKKTQKADKGLAKMGKAGGVAARLLVKTAAAAAAVTAAVAAMVVGAAKGRREIELLSAQAKTSVENFKALSFATSQYGINAEQIADISKDLSDKVGEFARDATGPFEDFRNQMKLSKNQAKDLAVEFESLSSEQVIGRMIKMMEDAGTSGDQMTQVLESMGNDLSKLKPLFSDNAKELKLLKDGFNEINKSISITAAQAEQLKKVAGTYDLLTSSVGNATTAISANLAPEMDAFFNSVIEIVPVATQAIINFMNSFRDPANIKKEFDINVQIDEAIEKIKKLTEAQKESTQVESFGNNVRITSANAVSAVAAVELEETKERLIALREQLVLIKEVTEAKKIADAEILEGGRIGGDTGTGGVPIGEGKSSELKAIEDSFLNESELLIQKYERDKEILDREVTDLEARNELKVQLQAKLNEDLGNIGSAAADKVFREADKARARQERLDKIKDDNKKNSAKLEENIANGAMALAALVFADNKEISAGIAFVNTAQGVTKALATENYVSAATIAVMGAGQISAILSAGRGGGSAASVSAPAPTRQQSNQQDFQQDTASLEVASATSGGSQTGAIIFATDTGDALLDLLAEGLNKGQNEGRF